MGTQNCNPLPAFLLSIGRTWCQGFTVHPAQNLLDGYGQPWGLSKWLDLGEEIGPGCFQNLLMIKKKKVLETLYKTSGFPNFSLRDFDAGGLAWDRSWNLSLKQVLQVILDIKVVWETWINKASLHTPVPQPMHVCVGWGVGGEVCPWLMKLLAGHYISKRLQILGCQLSRISHHRITLTPRQPVLLKGPVCLCPLTHC